MPLFDLTYPQINLARVPGFRYSGGKYELRKYIARFCPKKGSIFCEPFVGRANMRFLCHHLLEFDEWILNDLYTIPFLKSVRDYDGRQFKWPSEEEYKDNVENGDGWMKFMEPALFWSGMAMTIRAGKKKGKGTTAFVLNYENSKVRTEKSYRRNVMRASKILLEPTNIFSVTDACEWIQNLMNIKDAFIYLDPPYLDANVNSYHDKMIFRPHMIKLLKKCKCRWLLSEYNCHDLVKAFGEPFAKIYVNKKASIVPGAKSPKKAVECLWSNYDAKPMPVDFGGEQARSTSIRLLRKHGTLTPKLWIEIVPPGWDKELVVSEFNKLKNFPYAYWNGREMVHLCQ